MIFYVVSVDETLPKKLMPIGTEGELWIGGVGVGVGYLNAPELTKEVVKQGSWCILSNITCILSIDRHLHHLHLTLLTI